MAKIGNYNDFEKNPKKGTFGKGLAPNSTFTIQNGLQIRDFQIRCHFLGPKNRELGGFSVLLEITVDLEGFITQCKKISL